MKEAFPKSSPRLRHWVLPYLCCPSLKAKGYLLFPVIKNIFPLSLRIRSLKNHLLGMDESLRCWGAQQLIWLCKALWCATRGGTLLLSGKAYAISNKCLGFLNTKFKPAAAIGDKIGSYGLGKWCGAFGATGNFSGVFHTQHQPVSRDGSDSMVRSKACFCSSLL